MSSAYHFAREVPLTMTSLAALLETFSDTVFTVCFHKQPTVERVVEVLNKLSVGEVTKKAREVA